MDNFPSYQNGNQEKQQDFQKLALTVETSIQKISQNGEFKLLFYNYIDKFI